MSIRNQVISSVKWTTISSLVTNIIGLVQLMILTRYLLPSDFGLIAIAMVAIGFSELFIDIGISNAIIFKQDITANQLSTLYWLNVITGFIFFILLIIIAPFLSLFYKEPQLTPVLILVAITFIIKPWGQQYLILLQKNLQFESISKSEVISRVLSLPIVLILAISGMRVYSLVIGAISYSLFSTIAYIYVGRYLRKPFLYLNIIEVKDLINFGLYQMGEKFLNYFAAQFDAILIGKLLGIEVLGVYNIAKNIAMKPFSLFNPIATKIAFPLMSKVNKNIIVIRSYYLRIVEYLAYLNIPVYFLIFVLASPLVNILFGRGWDPATPILKILSLTYIITSIVNPQGILLLSLGKAKTTFYWNLFVFLVYPASILLGAHKGILGVTLAMLALRFCLFILSLEFIVKPNCTVSTIESLNAISKPFLISCISIIIPLFIQRLINNNVFNMIIITMIFCSSFLILSYFIDRRLFVQTILNFLKKNPA
jgi:O-antigen/teichoic acid export membrane protein